MGQVIDLNKKHKGVLNEIVNIIDATELEKDKDFRIVSILVMDDDMDMFSLGGFLKASSNELIRGKIGKPIDIAKSLVKGKNFDMVYETPFPKSGMSHLKFYEIKSDIDIDLAIEVGLGVVEYKGKYHLYYPFMQNDPKHIVYEMLMLKVYVQLLNPEKIDINLATNFAKSEEVIMSRIIIDMPKHMNRLNEIFNKG